MKILSLIICFFAIIISLTRCSIKIDNNSNNPLLKKNTDERILMCLEDTYPGHRFSTVKSFDKSIDSGIYKDENGLEFEVHSMLYNNLYHFGCKNDYLLSLLKKEKYEEKANEIVKKYNQEFKYDDSYTMITISFDKEDAISTSVAAEMILEVLNSVEITEVIFPDKLGFSTREINYYSEPVWGVLRCEIIKDGCISGTQFYFEDKNKSTDEIEEKIVEVIQFIDDRNELLKEE